MVFNTTFNNISVISWWSVLLVEETRVPRENRQWFSMGTLVSFTYKCDLVTLTENHIKVLD